jgi:carboxyl-terminal processing protease
VPTGDRKYTSAGREVYGGGGISPDISVSYPRVPEAILEINSSNSFFKYATHFAAKDDRRTLDGAGIQPQEVRAVRPKDVRLIDEGFRVDDEILEDFFGFLDDEGVKYSREELLAERDRLALQIEVEIYSALWGAEAAQAVAAKQDPQVQAGIDALPQAAELLADPVAYAKRHAASLNSEIDRSGVEAGAIRSGRPQ